MLEPTKKPLTDTVELHFLGPRKRHQEAVRMLRSLGFRQATESVAWRDALPFDEEQLPGICLSGARHREGLSQRELAKRTGIPQRHISEMENGKRPIGKERAKALAKALNTTYRAFL